MTNHDTGVFGADPTNTFLKPAEVFRRYRWGRTKGYQMLGAPGFPRAIGGTYRLDTLAAWEERELAGCAEGTTAEPVAGPTTDPAATGTATAATTPTAPDTAAAWSPSTRRPATVGGRARKSGGE